MYTVYRCYQHTQRWPGIKCVCLLPKYTRTRTIYPLLAPGQPPFRSFSPGFLACSRPSRLSCYLQTLCRHLLRFGYQVQRCIYTSPNALPMYIHHRTNAIHKAENQPDANIFETNKQHIIRLFKLYHKLQQIVTVCARSTARPSNFAH